MRVKSKFLFIGCKFCFEMAFICLGLSGANIFVTLLGECE